MLGRSLPQGSSAGRAFSDLGSIELLVIVITNYFGKQLVQLEE
jgi:hypothetical protein